MTNPRGCTVKLRFILPFALLCLLLSLPARAQYELYEFSLIAETGGTFTNFSANPAINNAGTVAFGADLSGGGSGIFTGSGGDITPIATTNPDSPFFAFSFTPSINDAGTVAFFAGLRTGSNGIAAGSGEPATVLYSGGPTGPIIGSDINNSGSGPTAQASRHEQ